jgi:glucose-6-phosphate 1-dehydrogenase
MDHAGHSNVYVCLSVFCHMIPTALDERKAEIRVQFKNAPGAAKMFGGQEISENELVMRLQPDEAVYCKTNVKSPGLATKPIVSELDLSYKDRYDVEIFDAYTRLILEVIRGRQATFVRDDELKASWEIFTPLLHQIDNDKIKPIPYEYGSRGPPESDKLTERVGYAYRGTYKWSKSQSLGEQEI